MVDYYGRWTYVPNEPESKWCDLDRIAHWIESQNYKPKTGIENITIILALHFEGDCEDLGKHWPNSDVLIEDIALFVEQTGSLKDFDYEP